MEIRIAGIVPESFVDGEGIRFAIFFQGCVRNCFNCHNPATHALDGGKILDTAEIIQNITAAVSAQKKALSGKPDALEIAVDNAAARGNCTRFAQNAGYRVSEAQEGAAWVLKLEK